MTTTADGLVADYLARLDAAAAVLPPDRRTDLLEGIGEHISTARATGAAPDEAGVRTLLDRLGRPEEIVAAAREDAPSAPLAARPPGTGLELAAVLMLTAGSLLPVVGWLVGVALLWSSRRWQLRDKLLGTLVVPLGPGGLLLGLAVLPAASCAQATESSETGRVLVEGCASTVPWPVLLLAGLLAVALPIAVAVHLMRVARARAATEPPVAPVASTSPWTGLDLTAVLLLGLGGLLVPVVPALVGLVMVCASSAWTRRVKAAVVVAVLAPIALLASVYVTGGSGLGNGGIVAALLLTPLLAGLSAVALALRLSKSGRPA